MKDTVVFSAPGFRARCEIGTFTGAGGRQLRYGVVRAHTERRALLYLHGIESHGGWFVAAAEALAERGCTTYLLDRRGSGLNIEIEPGDAASAEVLLEDVRRFREHAGLEQLVLVGLSWGGKLALSAALDQPQGVCAIVLVTPGLVPRVDYSWPQRVRIAASLLFGGHTRFHVPIEPEMFTRTPRYLDYIVNDPLRLQHVSARFLFATRALDRRIRAHVHTLKAPVLLLLAGHDRIIDNERTKALLERLPGDHLRVRLYERATHSIQFEETVALVRDVERFLEDVSMLTAISVEIARIAIPFRFGFRHALAERKVGDGVLVTVRDERGRRGYGECAPREYVSGETSQSVVDALARRAPRLLRRSFASFEELFEELAHESAMVDRDELAAFCALELAWLDLGGQVFQRSAGESLGPVCTPRVEYSGIVSASGKVEAVKTCETIKKLGVKRVKVKVGGDRAEDLEVLAAVREVLGDKAGVRVDANAAWDAETALARLHDFERFCLEACEQPCAADDFAGMAWLTARSPIPVIADESLVSLEDARRLIELRACHIFNVRISKCGGLLGAQRIRDLARAAGIETMLGAHVGETAILAAAGRQFAARTPGLRFAEGSYGKLLLQADVSDAMDLGTGGAGAAMAGHGLGLNVDLERVSPYILSNKELAA